MGILFLLSFTYLLFSFLLFFFFYLSLLYVITQMTADSLRIKWMWSWKMPAINWTLSPEAPAWSHLGKTAPCSFYYVMIEGQMKMRFMVVGGGKEVKLDVFIRSQRPAWFSLARAGHPPPPTGLECVSGQQLSGVTLVLAVRGEETGIGSHTLM